VAYRASQLVRTNELADYLGISGTEIRKLANQGILEKARHPDGSEVRGSFALKENVKRYIAYLKARRNQRHEVEASTEELKRRKLMADVEFREMRLAVERAELHPSKLVADLYGPRMIACRDAALSLPTKLAQMLAAESDVSKVFNILTVEVEEVLTKLAAPTVLEVIQESHRYVTETDQDETDEEDEGGSQETDRDPEGSRPARGPTS
jgi:hypothetical protein